MTKDHWNDHARQWSYIGTPLRPCAEDIQLIESYMHENDALSGGGNALLLGVTPELALMRWPENTRLLAIDRNQAMIDGVWPREDLRMEAKAVSGDWLATPCKTGSMGIAVGDGCLTLLSFQQHYAAFFQEVQRVISPEGCFVIRHFTRPQKAERVDDIFSDLLQGNIGNFHVFKWRLAMALHGSIEEGVVVGEIWDAWNEKNIPLERLVEEFGWSRESICTIDNYKNVDTVYTFPTVQEVTEMADQYFTQEACHFMDYELGERCPTFFLKPKK